MNNKESILAKSVEANIKQRIFNKEQLGTDKSKSALDHLLSAGLISNHLERVLVLPIGQEPPYRHWQLIFGYGEQIQENIDIFILWNTHTDKGSYFPFDPESVQRETLSYISSEINIQKEIESESEEELDEETGLWKKTKVIGHKKMARKRLQLVTVNDIKEAIIDTNPFFDSKKNKPFPLIQGTTGFILTPQQLYHIRGLTSALLMKHKNAFFLLLRDVCKEDILFKSKKNKIKSKTKNTRNGYREEPYSVVRDFLRQIGVLAERRHSAPKKWNGQSSIDKTIKYLDNGNITPTPSNIRAAIRKVIGIEIPKKAHIDSVEKDILES